MSEGAGPKLITFEHTSAKHLLDKLRREIERVDAAEIKVSEQQATSKGK